MKHHRKGEFHLFWARNLQKDPVFPFSLESQFKCVRHGLRNYANLYVSKRRVRRQIAKYIR